jgi:type 1 fimbriae regulatory protein FimB/type 1 fimbriae regulatory protein FimE
LTGKDCQDNQFRWRQQNEGKNQAPARGANPQNRTMPLRPFNSDLRKREYLTPHEIEKLIKAASKSGKTDAQGQRNATLVLVAYRHGLRAQELCDLEWSQVDWKAATLHVRRVKSGKPAAHPIRGDELRALRELKRNQSLSL